MGRAGLTLFELLIVLVLISMLALWTIAPLRTMRDGLAVRLEQQRLVVALDEARGASIRLGVATRLALSDSAFLVTAVSLDGDSITPWRAEGAGSKGVHLTGAGAALQFSPSGIAMGVSNRTFTLTKGSAVKKVVVSRLGRITQ